MKKALASLAAMAALCATPVLAADMPLKAPPPPPAPIYTWTGFYIGGFGGWGWSDQNWTFPDGDPLGSGNRNGPLGGFQAGYDYQLSPTGLIGIQADVSFGNITGNAGRPSPDGRCWSGGDQTADCAASAKLWSTATVRFGILPTENTLVYFKTGAAWVGQDLNVNNIIDITGGTCSPIGSHHANYNTNRVNYVAGTVGVGVEERVWKNLSAFAEFDYIGGSNFSVNMINTSGDGCVPSFPAAVSTGGISILKGGLNFRF